MNNISTYLYIHLVHTLTKDGSACNISAAQGVWCDSTADMDFLRMIKESVLILATKITSEL